MTTTTRNAEVEAYLAGVATALADLPDDDRQDLLDELGAHLDELSHETDAPLHARLGAPADYAAELRAAAGLPPATRRVPGIAERLRPHLTHPTAVAVREFLVVLRPMWWVVRGWAVVAIFASVFYQPGWSRTLVVIPYVDGGAGLLLTLVAVVVSVQIGRGRIRLAQPWGRRILRVVNIVCVLALLPLMSSLASAAHRFDYGVQYATRVPAHGAWSNGHKLRNIYAYDATGSRLADVRLYDQSGHPIDLDLGNDAERRQLVATDGSLVTNSFPLRYFERGTHTVADPSAGPDIVVPPLVEQPMTSPSPTETPTPSGSPSPSASTKR